MIKHLLIAVVLGMFIVSPVNAAVPRNFDSYVNAALTVYLDNIKPSVKTSELFYDFLKMKWTHSQCATDNECRLLGTEVASEFARMIKA